MDKNRRNLIKGAAAAGGIAAFGAGYYGPLEKMGKGLMNGTAGKKTADRLHGNSLSPEYSVDPQTGEITLNPDQRIAFTVCYGCTTQCGVRVRIDNNEEKVLRVSGNPYHPLSADEHLDEDIPVLDALKGLSSFQDRGQLNRSTACARGNAAMAQLTSNKRVLQCLKRVGPRGSGQWQTVSFEQLLDEIVEGGDLFAEGAVDGLRAIRDVETPLDANNPEYGPKANQLLMMEATDYGRSALLKRFAFNAFGTRNYGHHGAYCGLAFRMGSGALMNDLAKNAHVKPDFANTKFALFIGTAPSQAGNPFKRQGRLLGQARSTGSLEYVVVDPALNAAASHAASDRNRWISILPGTDTALAMGLIRWMLENNGYAADYLALPGHTAASAAGEAGHSNATHLVIDDDSHPRAGYFLRLSDLGQAEAGSENDHPVVVNNAGDLESAEAASRSQLFVKRQVDTAGGTTTVRSSLFKLRQQAQAYSIEEYADYCGIEAGTIKALAKRFARFGRQAVADAHGGMMSGSGFYASWGVNMLNLLAGSYNQKGGMAHGGGKYNGMGNGPRYDLESFPGQVGPKGVFLSRSRFPYEKTSEYKRHVANGESPYPAKAPWRKLAPPILTEHLLSGIDGYPYHIKAMIGVMANPLYGQAGLTEMIESKLKDPKNIGLYVAVDGFINETNRYADYIVPDSVMYEVWGFTGAWSGTVTKMTTACWPVVEPRQAKTAAGEPVSMDSFFIELAKRLDLPGFGDNAIAGADGKNHPLNRAEDYYLRAAANIALAGKPLADASAEDIHASGIEPLMERLQGTLAADEVGPVAHLYSRGGRFEKMKKAYDSQKLGYTWTRPLCVYNEEVGTTIDSYSGKRLVGTPMFHPPRFWDGSALRDHFTQEDWPLLAFSFKSNLMNSYAIGLERLRMIKPYNPVLLHYKDAEKYGVKHGDAIAIESPGGRVVALALVGEHVHEGALGIEHGYGHRELGAGTHVIDGEKRPGNEYLGAGVNLNDLGFADPTRKSGTATWLENVSGASVRQGLPVRISVVNDLI
ncbi:MULTISPECIES: molybdopterin-dependent oxidoreductase [unclassified Marinobacter]|jgi:tetrathionate reductase subunit A|uniref:molybdopterin-dependent oxidoreductase n=1 Tax=unclassified Marinobacter TaxID=83889 RepID=UPI00200DC44C|nr:MULTISPECIES: molybdopterin-dependent oxidoreductase [unclassified Marinobacter]MCL1477207.1 tetrathionate reductase subunit TtrA [Marinobacter sp.]MCL1480683.1 tetrathionate reductase subunit TtrA [Marinobacter sp.]MCL1484908.1 tetrathionate reductase subunit TtrA [Marinobacter sp.]UQG56434.1 tetrathionate reductase subunit TtrA [Marinobacter sp. M4C]UQG65238.1 tetrathionate reductase subunit TtrA [Marinobacter sp. M2C]